MKLTIRLIPFLCVACVSAGLATAQTAGISTAPPNNLAAVGVSYGSGVAGTGLYGKLVAGTGTYAFTVMDAVPASYKPFTVTTSEAAGIAQKVVTIGKVPIYIPTAAGVSYNGSNTGWAWSTGGLASIPLKRGLCLVPNVRVVKSSVSAGSRYQLIGGVLVGWGW